MVLTPDISVYCFVFVVIRHFHYPTVKRQILQAYFHILEKNSKVYFFISFNKPSIEQKKICKLNFFNELKMTEMLKLDEPISYLAVVCHRARPGK